MADSSGPSWPSAAVAIAVVGLVGLMFWKAVESTSFTTIWAAVGSVVGVITGAVPSYFFRVEAKKASARAEAIAAEATPEAVANARAKAPEAFS